MARLHQKVSCDEGLDVVEGAFFSDARSPFPCCCTSHFPGHVWRFRFTARTLRAWSSVETSYGQALPPPARRVCGCPKNRRSCRSLSCPSADTPRLQQERWIGPSRIQKRITGPDCECLDTQVVTVVIQKDSQFLPSHTWCRHQGLPCKAYQLPLRCTQPTTCCPNERGYSGS